MKNGHVPFITCMKSCANNLPPLCRSRCKKNMRTASYTFVSVTSVNATPSSISARVSYHGHFHEHGHYRGQIHALHQQPLDHYSTQHAV